MIRTILVVCEGNVCRSPMAEALFHARLPDRTVTSAGINALVGMQAAKFSQDVMSERGLELSGHRARQLRYLMCVEADLILVMEREQKNQLEIRYPFARGRIFRLGEHENFDILDPYRQPRILYERCVHLIELGVAGWLSRLKLVERNARQTDPVKTNPNVFEPDLNS
jgi:protein-tyrosine phosphatase